MGCGTSQNKQAADGEASPKSGGEKLVSKPRFKDWAKQEQKEPLRLLIRRSSGDMAGIWQVATVDSGPAKSSDTSAATSEDQTGETYDPVPPTSSDPKEKYKEDKDLKRSESNLSSKGMVLSVRYEGDQATITEDVKTLTTNRVRFIEDYRAGDSVTANYQGRGTWYKAHVAGPSPYQSVTLGKKGSYFVSAKELEDLEKRKRGLPHSKLELLNVDHMLALQDGKYELGEEVVDLIYEDGEDGVRSKHREGKDMIRGNARVDQVVEMAVPVRMVKLAKRAHAPSA